MSSPKGSPLFYYGTTEEVQLGDHVRLRRRFRTDLKGVVSYIPGFSKMHSELEYDDVKQWAIRCDDGTIRAMAYYPNTPYGQPPKHIVLEARGSGREILPNELLE